MRQALAVLLCFALRGPLIASPDPPLSVKKQIASLPVGTKLRIATSDGEVVGGNPSFVEETNFTIIAGRAKKSQVVAFADVQQIIAKPKTHTSAGAWIAFGAIVSVAVIAVAILLIERNNA